MILTSTLNGEQDFTTFITSVHVYIHISAGDGEILFSVSLPKINMYQ